MDGETTLGIIDSAERAALILLSVQGQLEREGLTDLARLVGVAYMEAATSAEKMGACMGMGVKIA